MATNRGLQDIQKLIDVIFKYLIVVHSVTTSTNFNIFPGGSREQDMLNFRLCMVSVV
jgi:hypothetical protein